MDGKSRSFLSPFPFASYKRSLSPAIDFYQGRVFRAAGKIFAQGNRTAIVVAKLSASYSRPSDPDRINLVEQYVFYPVRHVSYVYGGRYATI